MARAPHDRRGRVLVALLLTMALVAMDTTIVAHRDPAGGRRPRWVLGLIGWVFSIYLLAQTVTIPIYGKLADLYGRKPVLLFGVVLFLIGSALKRDLLEHAVPPIVVP